MEVGVDAEASGRENPQRYPDKVNLEIAEGTTNDRGAQGHRFGKNRVKTGIWTGPGGINMPAILVTSHPQWLRQGDCAFKAVWATE